MRRSLNIVVGVLLAFASSALAQDIPIPPKLRGMSLEELVNIQVTTASKSMESIDNAPNVMYVITADQIRKRGYKNLKDALRSIPGISVVYNTNVDSAVVRGIKSLESIVFMVNGHSINNITETAIYNGPMNLANIERIEIIVGPGSVMYPPDTCTAIVNIIPKTDLDGAECQSTGLGGYSSASFNSGTFLKSPENRLFISATIMRQDGIAGYSSSTNISNRSAIADNKVVDKVNLSNSLLMTATMNDWFFQYYHLDQDMPYVQAYNIEPAKEAHRYDYIDSFIAKQTTTWTDDLLSTVSLSVDNKRYIRTFETTQSNANNENFDLSQRIYTIEADMQYTLGSHFLQSGLLYQYKQNRHNYMFGWNLEDPDPYVSGYMNQMVDLENTTTKGIYLSDKYTINSYLTLVGAIRADMDEVLEDDDKIYPSPRLAAIYRMNKRQTFKLMYNRATRMPSPWYSMMNALWGRNNPVAASLGSWATSNTRADEPEVLTTYEVQSITYFGNSRLSMVGYYQELKNFMDWNNPFTNVGDYSGYGADVQLYTQQKDYAWWLNFSWNEPQLTPTSVVDANLLNTSLHANSSGDIIGSPKYVVTGGVEYNIGKFTIVPMCRYEGRSPYAIESNTTQGYNNHNVYVDLSITLSELLGGSCNLNLTGQNIFNNTDAVGVLASAEVCQPRGAWWLLTAQYKF